MSVNFEVPPPLSAGPPPDYEFHWLEDEEIGKKEPASPEAKTFVDAVLKKVSDRLGTNPGGWYEDMTTHERH